MAQMKPETKKRIQTVLKYSKTAFHWGFIPLIIYLGLKQGGEPGMPEPTLLRGKIIKECRGSWQSLLSSSNSSRKIERDSAHRSSLGLACQGITAFVGVKLITKSTKVSSMGLGKGT